MNASQTSIDPPVTVLLDGPDWLRIAVDIPGIVPDELLRWFVEPDLLTHWWGDEAEIEREPGGRYEVRWPAMEWTKRGQIGHLTADTLVYSWAWDHEPDLPSRCVIVHVEAAGSGTRPTITRGPYRQSDAFPREDEDRQSLRDGWAFFLPKLLSRVETEIVERG